MGLNRRDGGDRARDNEHYTLSNLWPLTKYIMYKRYGTTADLSDTDLFGVAAVDGLARQYTQGGDAYTLYHCKPVGGASNSVIPQPTQDLTLADVTGGGDLFGGGAIQTLYVAYTWIGMGNESRYNSASRVGFSFPAASTASTQAGHQTKTLAANTNTLRVTAPATFPSGVRGCNIFVARGNSTELTYVGTINTPGGTLDVKRYIGPSAAVADAAPAITASAALTSGGALKPGQYYVAVAHVFSPAMQENSSSFTDLKLAKLGSATLIRIGENANSITVSCSAGASANGAKSAYVFIGRKDSTECPMVCVGIIATSGTGNSITITSIPDNQNAQSAVFDVGGTLNAYFWQGNPILASAVDWVSAFMLKKSAAAVVSEVFMSRTEWVAGWALEGSGVRNPLTGTSNDHGPRWGHLVSPATNSYVQPGQAPSVPATYLYTGGEYSPPVFTRFLGLTYFVNGAQLPIITDGQVMGTLQPKGGTLLPPLSKFITVFKNSLVVGGSLAKNQVYFSNAVSTEGVAYSWVTGGTGTALNFQTIGEPFGDGVSGLGVFSYTTGTSGPQGFIMGFKRNSVWTTTSLTAGNPLEQISGKVGCIASNTIRHSRMGTIFLASDGDIYLIRANGEPVPIGGKVQPFFQHLVSDPSLMAKCTAVVHDNFYKISYPSSSTSTYNDAQIYADLRTQEGDVITWWGPHTGLNVGAQIVFDGENDTGYRYGCSASSIPKTFRLDDPSTFQDLGVSYNAIVEWKTSRFQAEMHMKRYLGMHVDAYYDSAFTHSLLMEAFVDESYAQVQKDLGNGGATYGSSNWDQGNWSDAAFFAIPLLLGETNLVGRSYRYRLTHTGDAPFIMQSHHILMIPERRLIV